MLDASQQRNEWFLTPAERDNPASVIDRGRGTAWTDGNDVRVHVDGAAYFQRLLEVLVSLDRGDSVSFTDWEGQHDQHLDGSGSEVGEVMARLARRGVDVRGLLWRSHPRQAHFAEQDNAAFARTVDEQGGELLLDERVKRDGSHHQKLLIAQTADRPNDAIAFEGGIDLCHGRNDDSAHQGDEQAVELDRRFGPRPPWHDIQLELRGPVVGDLVQSFRERWDDNTPLDHRNPLRLLLRRLTGQPRRGRPLPPPACRPSACGSLSVQVLRTYPAKRPRYPFAPRGERSIARAYLKAFERARSLVYIEDQYFWSIDAASALARALRRHPGLHVIVVVPRFPDRDGRLTGPASRVARADAVGLLQNAGGDDRVAIYDIENENGVPIYVHAKVCIVDDVWMTVGSDNLNRRSWTHDSEISCAILDTRPDLRAPIDPAGLGDKARVLPRETRLRLWHEHLGRRAHDDGDLLHPRQAFNAFAQSAATLDAWHRAGRRGARPPGHARPHAPDAVGPIIGLWARRIQSLLLDPDGRPRRLRRSKRY